MPTNLLTRVRSACFVLVATLASGWAAAVDQPAATAEARCNGFQAEAVAFQDKTAHLVSSTYVPAGPVMLPGGPTGPARKSAPLPAHCEVFGVLQERTGADGQHYAIRFHMRLPIDWNHRFVFQGGGGSDGEIGDAVGNVSPALPPLLIQGYAVVSQDSGHDNATNNDPARNGVLSFGFDPEARSNYGHKSLKAVAQAGKDVLLHFYHAKPLYSYFVGCSKGGQEGMMFAQRYPEEFDGIIAAAPGFSLPRAAVTEAWDVQVFGGLVKPADAATFDVRALYKSFSAGDFDLVRASVLDACDGDDGLRDGIVGDYQQCTDAKVIPRLRARACKAGKEDGCLSEAQIAALIRSRQGPRTADGKPVYSDWPWAAGVAGEGWRIWKIGTSDGKVPALNVVLGAASLASVFTTPPQPLGNSPQALADYQMGFDVARDAARIYATDAQFRHSGWEDIGARSADLSAFRKRGGRMIVPHGDSDPVFSLNDTLNWYREVDAGAHGAAASFVRVFPVPGMCHCFGGQATDRYDAFAALVRWVEQKQAPDQLIATAGPESPWPGRERPICAYPAVARYKGRGDPEVAASFECKP